ncbi:MAG: PA14 domain-containing protein [Caldilinea sp.]
MQTRFASHVKRHFTMFFIVALLVGILPAGVHAQQANAGALFLGDGWQASYWNNLSLSGAPVLTRTDADVNFNWGLGSPASEVNVDNFSARWTRTLLVTQPGSFRFTLNSDDGSRLFINNQLVINAWYDHGASRTFSATRELPAGSHEVRIEYYERRGAAVMRFGWAPVGGATAAPPPPPPADSGTAVQPIPVGQWRGEYFNNRDLLGAPALVRGDAQVDFNWGFGSPAPNVIGVDNFSVRWTNTINFPSGVYRFRMTVDDGVRVFVNERLVIESWKEQAATTLESGDIALGGAVPIRVEYFEAAGEARAALSWFQTGAPPPTTPAPPPPIGEVWTAEYFNNTDLSGAPTLVRGEGGAIDYNWGFGSPAPGVINNDFFSARWNRAVSLAAGTYRFRVLVDDGARLFVNNNLIIDQWRQQGPTEFSAEIALPGGAIPVRLEYVEFTGNAQVRLIWEQISGGGGGGAVEQPAPTWSRVRPARPYTGEYFPNRDLSGSPALVRQDSEIDFNWGSGSPDPAVPPDNFSVRWTNTIRLDRGKYRFTTETDDGVRLFINDRLVIDRWRTQSRTRYTHEATLNAGEYTIRMEYFDSSGPAIARLRIEVQREPSGAVGNIITCVPPQPQNYAWIKLYRLNGNNRWYSVSRGIGSINPTGFLKIDGLPVDVNRFGGAGEPYKVEQWIDGRVVRSTGDFQRGEPEFRVRAFADNYTPWSCPP